MPAEQKGSIYKTKRRGFAARSLENGKRLQQSGFPSRTEARNYFRDEVRPRLDTASTTIDPAINLEDFVKLYLTAHALNVETSALPILKSRLNAATKAFGKVELRKLERKAPEIAACRATLADGSRFGATQALRQCLEQAISWGVIQRNPAKLAGKNPQPKRAEVVPFTADELDRVCGELGPHAPLVRFASARPGCDRASGSRSSVATSTVRTASPSSSAATHAARSGHTRRRNDPGAACRCPGWRWTRSQPSRRGSTRRSRSRARTAA
jgi:hypothetical protein